MWNLFQKFAQSELAIAVFICVFTLLPIIVVCILAAIKILVVDVKKKQIAVIKEAKSRGRKITKNSRECRMVRITSGTFAFLLFLLAIIFITTATLTLANAIQSQKEASVWKDYAAYQAGEITEQEWHDKWAVGP